MPAASPAGPHIQQGHLGLLFVKVACVILRTEHPKVLSMLRDPVNPSYRALLCTLSKGSQLLAVTLYACVEQG